MSAPRVLYNHARIVDVLGLPLSLEQHHPRHRFTGAALQDVAEKWLHVAQESDLGARESHLFPQEPHQAIALRTASRISVAAGCENQPALLRRSFA